MHVLLQFYQQKARALKRLAQGHSYNKPTGLTVAKKMGPPSYESHRNQNRQLKIQDHTTTQELSCVLTMATTDFDLSSVIMGAKFTCKSTDPGSDPVYGQINMDP